MSKTFSSGAFRHRHTRRAPRAPNSKKPRHKTKKKKKIILLGIYNKITFLKFYLSKVAWCATRYVCSEVGVPKSMYTCGWNYCW